MNKQALGKKKIKNGWKALNLQVLYKTLPQGVNIYQ